jgi:hypothetical protein
MFYYANKVRFFLLSLVNFPSQPSTNNSNDILHQFVVGNPPTNSITASMTNAPSSGGDRCSLN